MISIREEKHPMREFVVRNGSSVVRRTLCAYYKQDFMRSNQLDIIITTYKVSRQSLVKTDSEGKTWHTLL